MNQPQYGSKPIRTEQTGASYCIICGRETYRNDEVCSIDCLRQKDARDRTTQRMREYVTPPSTPTHLIEEILSLSEPAQVKLNKIANLIRPC